MKELFVCMFLLYGLVSSAQVFTASVNIEVSANKTVSLVFPANIVSTDRGSNQVLVQKSADNILKVKAASDSCRETNLTVVTSDNKIYSFVVRYAEHPVHLTIHLGTEVTVNAVNRLEPLCNKVMKLKSNLAGMHYSSGKVTLKLCGWYVLEETMFCKLKMENRSQIGYDIEQLRFYIRDNNTLRRTASQEIIQQPLFVSGDTTTIKGKAARVWVVALNKFTIPDDKHFEVEILERNGGRQLVIKAYNRQVMLAKEL